MLNVNTRELKDTLMDSMSETNDIDYIIKSEIAMSCIYDPSDIESIESLEIL